MYKCYRVDEMIPTGVCGICNFSERDDQNKLRCGYHDHTSLNYRQTPRGFCALRSHELLDHYHEASPKIRNKLKKIGIEPSNLDSKDHYSFMRPSSSLACSIEHTTPA